MSGGGGLYLVNLARGECDDVGRSRSESPSKTPNPQGSQILPPFIAPFGFRDPASATPPSFSPSSNTSSTKYFPPPSDSIRPFPPAMKREYQHPHHPTSSTSPTGKGKMWDADLPQDAGMDELLAVLGYNVKASAMAEVAQKLEQLEEVIVNAQGDGLSYLVSEIVHYNPSDLSNWLGNMLSESNANANFAPNCSLDNPFLPPISSLDYTNCSAQPKQEPSIFDSPYLDYDLKAIPGKALYSHIEQPPPPPPPPPAPAPIYGRESKRLKPTTSAATTANPVTSVVGGWAVPADAARSVVLVDSQETGIRLVHTLMACAEAVQQENLKLAEALVKQIELLAVSQAGAMGKVAFYFAQGLAGRIYGVHPDKPLDTSFSDILQMHFYETCPYLQFAHFTANQAILEAFEGKKRVHVIDFSMKQGMQWPALMQALALRPGGPPSFRLTGIGPPSADSTDHLREVGLKLAQFAETIHVEFKYRGLVANSLADLSASMLDLRDDESVAVNSVFELHSLLARPGGIEKVLSTVKDMKPDIVTIVEQEANHNGPVFLDRFTESLHYYSTLFDSLEGCAVSPVSAQDKMMSEEYLGQQIRNVVACEGAERVERHETLTQWRARLGSAGFDPVSLGSNAFKQASMLLAIFASGDGYRVEENNGCLMLGWHTRSLIATSAWRLANKHALPSSTLHSN